MLAAGRSLVETVVKLTNGYIRYIEKQKTQ